MAAAAATRELLLRTLDEAFDRRAWHGPNLRASFRGLGAADAAWRPSPRRHCIHELVLHAAYWKYVVRRRLLGEKRGSFARAGSDWFRAAGAADERAWRDAAALLEREHRALRAAVASLHRVDARAEHLIRGAAFHDVYHAGQIRLLKRMLRDRRARG